jgi:hypothetical protein
LVLLENGKEIVERRVSGRFDETFVSGVCCVSDKLQAVCNGVVVKEIVNPYSVRAGPGTLDQPHELGILAP